MRWSKIEVGKAYLFDKDNHYQLLDRAPAMILVTDKNIDLFHITVIGHPIYTGIGIMTQKIIKARCSDLDELDLNDISKNVVVRYPTNVPVFSELDVQNFGFALDALNKLYAEAMDRSIESERVMLGLKALERKIQFYYSINQNHPIE